MTARLIAVGRVRSPHPTLDVTYALSDPDWHPEPSEIVDDPDLYDKQRKEEAIAADDLL